MNQSWKKYTYLVTILFFALGFFNILFAWMALLCLGLPFILLLKNKKKVWCQDYCPRANLFGILFRNRSLTGKAGPDWLTRGKAKWFVFTYFVLNLLVITMSTVTVSKGRINPLEIVRFLIVFKLPWHMPQLVDFGTFPGWMVHLSFRLYSMMFTTTVLGLLLAWLFKPRTWCTVCPVNTASNMILSKNRK